MVEKLKEFLDKSKVLQNDKDSAELQHKKGKLTAKERLKYLLDADSFVELGAFVELQRKELETKKKVRDGVVTGYGTINKRAVYVYAQDFSFMGGSMGEMHNRKIAQKNLNHVKAFFFIVCNKMGYSAFFVMGHCTA